ncbi:hypothetical protein CMEL01_13121, partial [Colletotrichum melonis]
LAVAAWVGAVEPPWLDDGPATSIVGSGSVSGAEGGWVPSSNVVGVGVGAGAGVDAGVRALVAHNQNAKVNYFGKHWETHEKSMRAPLQNRSHKISRTCSRSPLGLPACRMQGDAKREKPNGRKLSPSPNPLVERRCECGSLVSSPF